MLNAKGEPEALLSSAPLKPVLPNWYKRERFGPIRFSRKVTCKGFTTSKGFACGILKESEMDLFRNLVGDQQPGEVPRSEPDSDPYQAAASSVPPASVGGTSQASSLRPSTRNRTKEASKTAGTKYVFF